MSTRCPRCYRARWATAEIGEALCWGGLQCEAGRLAALEAALRDAAPYIPCEHVARRLLAAAQPSRETVVTAAAAAQAARRRVLVEFPTEAEADAVRSALAAHGYDAAKPSSLAKALLSALTSPG